MQILFKTLNFKDFEMLMKQEFLFFLLGVRHWLSQFELYLLD